jgi:MFS family permease
MSTLSQAASSAEKRTNARYWIVVMLFIVTSFNYGDRATLSIAGSEMAKDIGLDPIGMGYVFSAFSWAYVIGQIPGGWLLDRFGSKRVYFWSILSGPCLPCCKGLSIFSVASASSLPCSPCASWWGWLNHPLSLATVASLRPGSRHRKGARQWRFSTPHSTSQRSFSHRLWGG